MSDVLSEGKLMIEKLLDATCELMTESTVSSIGNILSSTPTYELTWKGEEREVGKLKFSFPITEGITFKRDVSVDTNAIIVQQLSLKEDHYAFQDAVGMLKGITEKSRFFIPCEFQVGVVIDHPIPAGVRFIYTGYGTHNTTVVPNRADSPPASEINLLIELVRSEVSGHNWSNSKMRDHLEKLPEEQSQTGGPPILGNSVTEYKLRFPRAILAIPYGMKTIITVSSQMRFDKFKTHKIEFQGKGVKVAIVQPMMGDLKYYLGALHQMAHLVEQTGYAIETYNDFKSNEFDLPNSLAQSLE